MKKLETYIHKHEIGPLISQKKHRLIPELIVVIPCFNEPDVLDTLQSLRDCDQPECRTEVIVVVNSGENTSEDLLNLNRNTFLKLTEFKETYNDDKLAFYPLLVQGIRKKHAGVGMARKLGMDQAVYRFNETGQEHGIIVSLDADTKVAPNYLTIIQQRFRNQALDMATISFEHPISGTDFNAMIYEGMARYELHLRYTKLAMNVARFPYSIHTVGSAFALRADVYAAHGGMNRKQGGEDFYFLHKIRPHVKFDEIFETVVYPSPRPSQRVPFGTGPQIETWCRTQVMETYQFKSFLDLQQFFACVDSFFKVTESAYDAILLSLPIAVVDFLRQDVFYESIAEINANASTMDSFRKRFFQNFNAFKVVKYLNYSHVTHYEKAPVQAMGQLLLTYFGIQLITTDATTQLQKLRQLEALLSQKT